jgi:hypothetical protein
MIFWREVCKEETGRLPEFAKTQTNLSEFNQYELATITLDQAKKETGAYYTGMRMHVYTYACIRLHV